MPASRQEGVGLRPPVWSLTFRRELRRVRRRGPTWHRRTSLPGRATRSCPKSPVATARAQTCCADLRTSLVPARSSSFEKQTCIILESTETRLGFGISVGLHYCGQELVVCHSHSRRSADQDYYLVLPPNSRCTAPRDMPGSQTRHIHHANSPMAPPGHMSRTGRSASGSPASPVLPRQDGRSPRRPRRR